MLESLCSPLDQKRTIVLLLQAVTEDFYIESCSCIVPNLKVTRHFQLLDIMVTWMSLRGSWAVPRSSLVLHWPVAMIPFLYLSSFIHYQLYQSGETKLCYNNKTAIPQRLIFYSHKI